MVHFNNNGKLHREDGPTFEYVNGLKEWYVNGKRHREDGPAVEFNGNREWYFNGKKHREDGPAEEYNGDKEWYINGKRHREDGPAVELCDGQKAWYINDIEYTEKEYNLELERIRKIRFNFFKLWEEICDQPGKKLFEIRMKRAMDNIEELENQN